MSSERPHLLIVDDEPSNSQLLKRIFQNKCEITTAENGRLALNALAQEEFDVVLLDIMMPEISGLDVLKIIRSRSDLAELPVVLISALGEKEEVLRGIRLGANDYITKPVDAEIVLERVGTQIKIKQLRDERSSLIAQLQAANEMKARMMQVASHDLKNPLNNLQMLTDYMRNHSDANPKINKMLNMQQSSLDAMLHVVLDFLDSGIANSKQIHVNVQPIEAESFVRQVLNQYSVAAHNKQINLDYEGIDERINADPNRFMQVVGNLLSNAIKYSPKGGHVYLSSEIRGKNWRLTVHDSGTGIPEAEQEFLFKPFSKHNISTQPTAGEASTGLGLWIVYEMMRLQEGSVGMYNHAEGGAAFWLELPLAPKSAEV